MSTSNLSSKSAGAGMLAAIVASLCCITPVLAFLGGIGGIAATFSWMEPFRPFLIALTVGVIGFAWYHKLKPRTDEEIACACEDDEKPSFWQSNKFLSIVTVFAVLMLAFPSYAHVFYPDQNNNSTLLSPDESTIKLAEFTVKGMTCAGCEEHVKHATTQLEGVLQANASHQQASAQIVFNASVINLEKIIEAVNKTGYSVTSSQVSEAPATAYVFPQDTFKIVELAVKGMTCSGCEAHITNSVGELEGVQTVEASYTNQTATIGYNPEKVDRDQIVAAINKTGYTVIEDEKKNMSTTTAEINDDISFYKVPLVCNAAPTIGCGSRSKPVLMDLEKSENVKEAWLNRAGTVIAIVWQNDTDLKVQRSVITEIFGTHKVNASELLMDDYANNMASFSEGEGWHQGSDVNALSKEEAGIIAEQIMESIRAKTSLNIADEHQLRERITATFYDFFLNYQSLEELGDPKVYKVMLSKIIDYGEDIVGEGNMPTLDELWQSCSNAAKSCNHEGCSGSSCSLTKKS